jgi:hypothetical protein
MSEPGELHWREDDEALDDLDLALVELDEDSQEDDEEISN